MNSKRGGTKRWRPLVVRPHDDYAVLPVRRLRCIICPHPVLVGVCPIRRDFQPIQSDPTSVVWCTEPAGLCTAILPNVFNYNGTVCRAVKGPAGDYMWVANDIANVLYPVEEEKKGKGKKLTKQEVVEQKEQELVQLKLVWNSVDEDGSGTVRKALQPGRGCTAAIPIAAC